MTELEKFVLFHVDSMCDVEEEYCDYFDEDIKSITKQKMSAIRRGVKGVK